MNNVLSISHILTQAGCDFAVFDLSRRVSQISSEDFIAIEQNQRPYPYPSQQHAAVAIAYWQENTREPWIWFLRFALDERGLLSQQAVGDFLYSVAGNLGALTQTLSDAEQQQASENPYLFSPTEDKKAVFHAKLNALLSLPASQYYADVATFYASDMQGDAWQHLGLQGIADICARLDEGNNTALVLRALDGAITPAHYVLLGCLEHQPIRCDIANSILGLIAQQCALDAPDIFYLSALIRALAGAPSTQMITAFERVITDERLQHKEVLIAIAGRLWCVLEEPSRLDALLCLVLQQDDAHFFRQLLADVAMLPTLRPSVHQLIRGAGSQQLLSAIRALDTQ